MEENNLEAARDMRKIVLYIAMSLDGYIADANGGVSWLRGQDPDSESEGSYPEFVRDIDTVVMGWETYHQVITELSPDEWVYEDLMTYVITHREETSSEKIRFVHESPSELMKKLKELDGKDIWICGGASIARQLMQDGMIDRFYISVIPVLLGAGVRLFGELPEEQELRLMETKSYNGIVELRYEKR